MNNKRIIVETNDALKFSYCDCGNATTGETIERKINKDVANNTNNFLNPKRMQEGI